MPSRQQYMSSSGSLILETNKIDGFIPKKIFLYELKIYVRRFMHILSIYCTSAGNKDA